MNAPVYMNIEGWFLREHLLYAMVCSLVVRGSIQWLAISLTFVDHSLVRGAVLSTISSNNLAFFSSSESTRQIKEAEPNLVALIGSLVPSSRVSMNKHKDTW